jgi:hypothetical protein
VRDLMIDAGEDCRMFVNLHSVRRIGRYQPTVLGRAQQATPLRIYFGMIGEALHRGRLLNGAAEYF